MSKRTARLDEERAAYSTNLLHPGPAPQEYADEVPPAGVLQVKYPSGSLQLMSWLSSDPRDGTKHPAVVYLHGGFAFGANDWDDTVPYRNAGFIVMTPALRGENGNPGNHEWWYGEVDDAVAAGRYLAGLPYVDAAHVFVAGHSSGGTETYLAALMPSPFKAAAPIGGVVHQEVFVSSPKWRQQLPFDYRDEQEVRLRSAVHFAETLRCPLYAFVGMEDAGAQYQLELFMERAKVSGNDCRRIDIPGNHFTSKPDAIRQSVRFFQEKLSR